MKTSFYMPPQTANLLTLIRIIFIPILVLAFYMDTASWRFMAAVIFIVSCFTDYLDGYIARTFSQTSRLGQFLDPIADKLLVSSMLLLLASFGRISKFSLIPALVILCREILVSGLREHLSNYRVTVAVSRLAKWKTGFQMLSICCLLVGNSMTPNHPLHLGGEILLWVSAMLTLITGYKYITASIRYF